MNRLLAGILLVLGILLCGACGPSQNETRINAELGSDGYALFRARHEGGTRLAFLVELRDAPAGTYALLHSRKAPRSVGWFDLDVDQYTACKRYGEEATDITLLGCVLPDGHGDLVDLVQVDATDTLLAPGPAAESANPSVAAPASKNAILRHEITAPVSPSGSSSYDRSTSSTSSTSSARSVTVEGFYAVMRVERDGTIVPIAAEVRVIDGNDTYNSPTVEQLE